MEAYLDNSATTRPSAAVLAAMAHALQEIYGNPSSLHRKGLEAEKALKQSRRQVAAALGASEGEIVFTSGGTESNNLALFGVADNVKRFGNTVITTRFEHPSVLYVFQELERRGFDVRYLDIGASGNIHPGQLQEYLKTDPVLISVMMVNNEIGSIQPLSDISRMLNQLKRKPLFHVDAVQALGKLKINVAELKVDLLSVSGHKIHGPKGIGALYIRKGIRVKPLMLGGGQENGLRPGTENLPGIVALGAAAAEATAAVTENSRKMRQLKQRLAEGIKAGIDQIRVNGPADETAAPHILNVSFRNIRGEVLVHALEQDGISVSTGSACSSRKKTYSHVLEALGLAEPDLEGAIRFSLSPHNTEAEIDYVIDRLRFRLGELRRIRA